MDIATITPARNTSADESGEYNWLERHEQVKRQIAKESVDLIFIGDSITHYFGGKPVARFIRGGETWDKYYGHRQVVNMGFGRDKTQNVLWRLENGTLDGIAPKLAVLLIGVNNILAGDTSEDIARGIEAVCSTLRRKLPKTKILLLGLLPFNPAPDNPCRVKVQKVNEIIEQMCRKSDISFLNIGIKFLSSDGTISPDIMPDGLHPNDLGYHIFASAIEPAVSFLLDDESANDTRDKLC